MNVVHINSFDLLGGAARAANRLHTGLKRLGVRSSMFVAEKRGSDDSVTIYHPPVDPWNRIGREVRRQLLGRAINRYRATAPAGLSFFSDDRTIYGRDPWRLLPEADVINLHWVIGFLDYKAFFSSLPPHKPVVWTLHGMDPMTGGCSFDAACGRFTAECGACPQFGSQSSSDLTHQVWQRKKNAYSKIATSQLQIVTPSRWLGGEVRRSSLLKLFDCTVIPNAVDTDVFAPRDRSVAREVLGVPRDAKVVLFLADGVDIPRKGAHLLTQALSAPEARNRLFLLSLGPGRLFPIEGIPRLELGPTDDDRFLSFVYSCADLLVAPSLQDNLPNTVLESMACGTPVVGSSVGGIPDMVRPGITGLLANPQEPRDLIRAILELLSDSERLKQMAQSCRDIACKDYSLAVQAKRYAVLYQDMIERNRSVP